MKITPNIGLWPTTEPDPLGRYLTSLTDLARLDVRLALPGHGRPITEWQTRLAELQTHHTQRLAQMAQVVDAETTAGGASTLAVAHQIFNFAGFSDHEIRFAIAETLAHLEYLVLQGRLTRTTVDGVWIYQAS